MESCTCSHYGVLLDDLPDDVSPHAPGCPLADPEPGMPNPTCKGMEDGLRDDA